MADQSTNDYVRANTRGISRFPDELTEFFTPGQGRTLLVRGDPGAGKTLFAIQALNVLCQDGTDILYVSTRVDTDTLYQNYFAGKPNLNRSNILDISQGPFESDITPAENLDTDDFDPESFLEWLQAMGDVSDPLTVAFDSWELVQRHLLSRTRRDDAIDPGTLVTRVAALARRHGLRIILVTEQADQTSLDYVVDGVVALSVDHSAGGRPERTLLLEKLRGVRIANRTKPFTLSQENFQVFTPVSLPIYQETHRRTPWNAIENSKAKFSTGIADLDEMLDGGYNRGSVVHFELGPDLSRDAWSLPCLATARNFLSDGMAVAVVPLAESSPGLVRHSLEPLLPDSSFSSHCDVFETYDHDRMVGVDERDSDQATATQPGAAADGSTSGFSYDEYLQRVESLRDQSDGPLLHIISMDAAGDVLSDVMSDHARYVALHNDLSILVSKPGSDERAQADRIADVHLRLDRRGEAVFLYGENPVTPFLGFDTETDTGHSITLQEMV